MNIVGIIIVFAIVGAVVAIIISDSDKTGEAAAGGGFGRRIAFSRPIYKGCITHIINGYVV